MVVAADESERLGYVGKTTLSFAAGMSALYGNSACAGLLSRANGAFRRAPEGVAAFDFIDGIGKIDGCGFGGSPRCDFS